MRTITAFALAAILAMTGVAQAQYSTYTPPPNRTTAVPPSTVPPPANSPTRADQFSSEGDAKAHCPGGPVVWLNSKSGIYHFAGSRNYGHTKQGAYMCRADADKVGRAPKNEKAPRG